MITQLVELSVFMMNHKTKLLTMKMSFYGDKTHFMSPCFWVCFSLKWVLPPPLQGEAKTPGYKGHPDKELGMLYGVQGLWDKMHSQRALQTVHMLEELLLLLNSHMLTKGVF